MNSMTVLDRVVKKIDDKEGPLQAAENAVKMR
jgi:hypothetical protein